MKKFRGFTLAEILITLSIIGIVAAIMIPSLLVNVNDKAYDAQRKALHARMAQAIGQLSDMTAYKKVNASNADDGSAVKFITQGLNKVYKISTVCEQSNLGACDIPTEISTMQNDTYDLSVVTDLNKLNSLFTASSGSGGSGGSGSTGGGVFLATVAGFRTTNGESIMLFYNPKCTDKHEADGANITNEVCINMIYDLNGASKTPNQVGKDIGFITVLNASTPTVVAPKPYDSNITGDFAYYGSGSTSDAAAQCKNISEDLILPDREQLISMFVNKALIGSGFTDGTYWSGTVADPQKPDPGSTGIIGSAWAIDTSTGKQEDEHAGSAHTIRCVKK